MAYFGQQRRDYQNARRASQRAWALQHLGGKCVVCGISERLEIHHVVPESKAFPTGIMWTKPRAVQLEELAKCELRCEAHHKAAHASRHGTPNRYNRGCRCDECRAAYSVARKKYRQRNLEHIRKRNRIWMREHYVPKRPAAR